MMFKVTLCCLISVCIVKSDGSLNRQVRELVEMCFTDNSNPVMISKDLLDSNWDPSKSSLIVIDREFNNKITGFLPAYPTYVLSFDSIDNLKPIVNNLQRSSFWNINSKFVMVEAEFKCPSTRTLEFMWAQDLLSVFYLCIKDNSTMIFTVNPFASYAPKPWVEVEKFGNKQKLTLFQLQYSTDSEICKSLTYDKTKQIKGTIIKMSRVFQPILKFNKASKRLLVNSLMETDLKEKFMNLIKQLFLMKARLKVNLIFDDLQKLLEQGYLTELTDKTNDINGDLIPIEAADYKYVDVVANYHERSYFILTKKIHFLTMISEAAQNVRFVVGTIVLFVLFTIAMVLINRNDVRQAVLDMVRLVVGMGLESPLNRLAMKLLFFTGFLFAFLIVPDFQGHVSAILSAPSRRNIETLKDLYDNKFHVYYWEGLENDMMNEQLWVTDEDKKYLHPKTEFALNFRLFSTQWNSKTAYIDTRRIVLKIARFQKNMHVSKEAVFKKQLIDWARKNWPLKSELEKIMQEYLDLGLTENQNEDKYYRDWLKKMKVHKKIEDREEIQQVGLDELMFSYYFFGFVVAVGILVFIIEVISAIVSRVFREFLFRGDQ